MGAKWGRFTGFPPRVHGLSPVLSPLPATLENVDEYERRKALELIEQLVREGRPEREIDREVEQLVGGETDSVSAPPRLCAALGAPLRSIGRLARSTSRRAA